MWKAENTPEAEGRLENLKELVRSMGEFPTLESFLEHVALVTDAQSNDGGPRVTIMTLHAAKGLEFDVVFLPGWEEGLFPSQRAVDDNGLAGLEEERRLAYVGVTRARRRVAIYFASNRQVRGLWQSSAPSRFHRRIARGSRVEVVEAADSADLRLRLAVRRGGVRRRPLRDAGLEARAGTQAQPQRLYSARPAARHRRPRDRAGRRSRFGLPDRRSGVSPCQIRTRRRHSRRTAPS